MSTAVITGGVVVFEQSRKLAEYENRKASVTFNVNAPDGQTAEDEVARALKIAQNYVLSALGLADPLALAAVVDATVKAVAATATQAEGKPKKAPKAPKAPPADPADLTAPEETFEKAAVTRQISNGTEDRKDPADLDPFSAPAPVITDAALMDAIGKKNVSLIASHKEAGTAMIKELIAKKGVTRYAEIPQSIRAFFLVELEALGAKK